MISDADTFWRQILARVRPGRVSDSVSLAEAEQRMAAAGEDEIAPERIARIARDVTGAAPAAARPQVVQGRVHRFPMARPALRWAVAATVALAPLAAVAFYKMYDEAPTPLRPAQWGYATALAILVDPTTEDDTRRSAQGRVFQFVSQLGIETVRSLRGEAGPVANEAERVLERWRNDLTGEPSGPVGSVTDLDSTTAIVRDQAVPTNERLMALNVLSDQIASGIAALREPVSSEAGFVRAQTQALERLSELLAR